MDWNIEDELKKLSGATSVKDALTKWGFISPNGGECDLVSSPEGWYRSGAETYLFRFRIRNADGEIPLILKACIVFAPGRSIDSVLKSWIERRVLLSNHGVITPKLYAWGNGVLLEEEIPLDLVTALKLPGSSLEQLLISLSAVGGVVAALRFSPIGLFSDLRSHGDDVVVVDFGQDLGPPSNTRSDPSQLLEDLWNFCSKNDLQISEFLKKKLRTVFEDQKSLSAR
jgi:hypothetical protein